MRKVLIIFFLASFLTACSGNGVIPTPSTIPTIDNYNGTWEVVESCSIGNTIVVIKGSKEIFKVTTEYGFGLCEEVYEEPTTGTSHYDYYFKKDLFEIEGLINLPFYSKGYFCIDEKGKITTVSKAVGDILWITNYELEGLILKITKWCRWIEDGRISEGYCMPLTDYYEKL